MRILSQNGKIDIPYEMIGISINHKDAKEIIAYPVISRCRDREYWRMAQYSTKEKAKRVMEMLKNEYHGYKIEETYHEGTEYYHPVFQFPQDNEVENKRTNACRIKNMTNEELAEFLNNICTDFENEEPILSVCLGEDCDIQIGDNYGDIKKWLESEI